MRRFAEEQGGNITWAQLLDVGMDRRTAQRWIATGKLLRVYRGVYALGSLPSMPIARAHAALLACGKRSAIAGASALVLWDVWKRWPDPVELVSATNRRPPGLIVHHSHTLLTRDIQIVNGVRVTSPARTLLDTATLLKPYQLTRAVNDLRLRRLLTTEQLTDVIERNPTQAGIGALRELLGTAQAEPTRSMLEDAFLQLLNDHDLPTPRMNVHVAGYRVDALFSDHRLIVELDGWSTHQTPEAFKADRRRDAEILAATGIGTVRLTYEDITREGAPTADRLRQIMSAAPRLG